MDQRHIVLIDDFATIRKMMRRALEEAGHVVYEAGNGDEGLDILQWIRPDLVITDIFMPDKEGIETIIEIRKRFPGIRILAISSGGTAKQLNILGVARRLGAHSTLAKPFSPEAFISQVNHVLTETRA
jgi:CheY-like chemotaxis protein